MSGGVAEAAAPAAALNKTITIGYQVNGESTTPEGLHRAYKTLGTETIYVSNAGRLFVRRSMPAMRSGRKTSISNASCSVQSGNAFGG